MLSITCYNTKCHVVKTNSSGTEFTRPYTVHEIDIENTGYDPTKDTDTKHVNETPGRVISLTNNAFSLWVILGYSLLGGGLLYIL